MRRFGLKLDQFVVTSFLLLFPCTWMITKAMVIQKVKYIFDTLRTVLFFNIVEVLSYAIRPNLPQSDYFSWQSFDLDHTEFTFDSFCFTQGSLNLTVTGIPNTADSEGYKVRNRLAVASPGLDCKSCCSLCSWYAQRISFPVFSAAIPPYPRQNPLSAA